MEGQTAPAPVAQPAPAPAPASSSAMSANNIIVTLFTGIITGFAIGLGLILSQKVTKKNVIVETKGDSSSANGQNPMAMYPPRMQRPPMGNPYGMQRPYGMPYNPYAHAEGSKQTFNIDSWLQGNRNIQLENLTTVQD